MVTPDGQHHPVCLELVRTVSNERTYWPEPGIDLAEPSREPGVGRIALEALKFTSVPRWGGNPPPGDNWRGLSGFGP
jgi:hypothetical protein